MDKLKMETPDMAAENVEKIAALFPSAVTEMRGEDGSIKKGVNFEMLKQLLSPDVVEEGDERYEFTWVGKKQAIAEAARPTTKTLRPVKEDSCNWDTTENLYIEGDNLEVLKILQESYLGKVKMIYIDPPYNTGHDFIYKDHFEMEKENYCKQVNLLDENGNRQFVENTESNPRFHSDWCSMMYQRLLLARNLLKEDGIIFISINDSEYSSLSNICDAIFGESNYIATLIWDKNHSAQSGIYKVYHEYIIVYARNRSQITTPRSLDSDLFEAGAMKKASGRHATQPFTFPAGTRFDAPDGVHFSGTWGGVEQVTLIKGDMYAVNGKLAEDVTLEAAYTQIDQMKEFFYGNKSSLVDSRGQQIVEFYLNASGKVKVIKKRGVETPQTTCHFGAQGPASIELASLFGLEESPFDAPKPLAMIKDFVSRFTGDSDLICDFFAGSSTTAHGIMELNAESKEKRKYILIQLQEDLDQSLRYASKDGKKTIETAIKYLSNHHKPHYVTEIGKERIRRAGDKIMAEHPDADLDIGFRVFRVDESNMKNVYYHPEEVTQLMLGETVSNIKEDRTDMDLLYACLLDWGVEINLPHTSTQVAGCTVHNVDNGALTACFDKAVPRAVVEYMANLQPLRAVFRDSAFATDAEKINVTEIFKNLSPDTKVKVI